MWFGYYNNLSHLLLVIEGFSKLFQMAAQKSSANSGKYDDYLFTAYRLKWATLPLIIRHRHRVIVLVAYKQNNGFTFP